ncbi:hypothetical protein AB0E85_23665 [Streptomyces sp. NPDC029044]|uniref:hypothetical protein n=1 Tax=Streptomyces sp. NPDC029044 TaxID=3157198 RepID=UPI0033E7B5A3
MRTGVVLTVRHPTAAPGHPKGDRLPQRRGQHGALGFDDPHAERITVTHRTQMPPGGGHPR